MKVQMDTDIKEYLSNENNFWSGARDRIAEWKYNDEVIEYLAQYVEDIFYDYDKKEVIVEDVTLNDFIWFDADDILAEAEII